MNGSAVDREHVKDDQYHLDPPLAVKHPVAQAREAAQAIIAERDWLAIDRQPAGPLYRRLKPMLRRTIGSILAPSRVDSMRKTP